MSYASVFEGQTEAGKLAAAMLVDFHERTGIPAREGNVETALIEVAAKAHADTRMVVGDMADQAMMARAGFLGVARKPATPAAADIALTGEQGLTIPAGSQFATEDETVWELVQATTLTSGAATARVVAAAAGPVGAGGLGEAVQIGPFAGLQSAQITRLVADGTEQESVGAYLDRAAGEMQIMSIVPRLPEEFARFATRHAQVAQARAKNGVGPAGQLNQPGHIGVYVANAAGTPMGEETLRQITSFMNAPSARPLGVQVNVFEPVRRDVTVEVTVMLSAGAVKTTVVEIVKQRLNAWLSPATWDWTRGAISTYDIAGVIANVEGVQWIDLVVVNGDTGVELATESEPFVIPRVVLQVDGTEP